MAELKSKARNALPASTFGLPGKRAYPMPDRSHAANAKARASQMVNAGKLSTSAKSQIDTKANKILQSGAYPPKSNTPTSGGYKGASRGK